eukprot:scaffold324495_cov50-Prasinocladus_malaysianus.AAC.1
MPQCFAVDKHRQAWGARPAECCTFFEDPRWSKDQLATAISRAFQAAIIYDSPRGLPAVISGPPQLCCQQRGVKRVCWMVPLDGRRAGGIGRVALLWELWARGAKGGQ